MERCKIANAQHDKGFNCAQSVLAAFADKIGMPEQELMSLAGGFGAGAAVFFGAELRSGIETVLDQLHFDEKLKGCDLVITGEGRLDQQSLRGKVVSGVARRAKAKGVPVVALVGSVTDESDAIYRIGVSAVFSINRRTQDFQKARQYTAANYRRSFASIIRLLRALRR